MKERGEYDRRGYQPAQFGRVAQKDIAGQIENLFALAGAVPSHGDGYPGWKPNLKSPLLDVAVKAYEELYDVTPAVKAIHAGLECGLFLGKESRTSHDFVRSDVERSAFSRRENVHSCRGEILESSDLDFEEIGRTLKIHFFK